MNTCPEAFRKACRKASRKALRKALRKVLHDEALRKALRVKGLSWRDARRTALRSALSFGERHHQSWRWVDVLEHSDNRNLVLEIWEIYLYKIYKTYNKKKRINK